MQIRRYQAMNVRQKSAYKLYKDMGEGRSLSKTAPLAGVTKMTLSKWARKFHWKEMIAAGSDVEEIQPVVTAPPTKDLPVPSSVDQDDELIKNKLKLVLDILEAQLNSTFTTDASGKITPAIKVNNMSDFAKLVKEYRETVNAYRIAYGKGGSDPTGKTTRIRELNITIGSLSQEERIGIFSGKIPAAVQSVGGSVRPGDDTGTPGGIEDADYTDVPGQGSKD